MLSQLGSLKLVGEAGRSPAASSRKHRRVRWCAHERPSAPLCALTTKLCHMAGRKGNQIQTKTKSPRHVGSSVWLGVPTWYAKLYLAGDIETAKQVCREECMREGLCVTVEPCEYIYTGGQESGYCVWLLNYPRFPSDDEKITARAKVLAELLMIRTCQWSALVMTPERTEWLTRRKDSKHTHKSTQP